MSKPYTSLELEIPWKLMGTSCQNASCVWAEWKYSFQVIGFSLTVKDFIFLFEAGQKVAFFALDEYFICPGLLIAFELLPASYYYP